MEDYRNPHAGEVAGFRAQAGTNQSQRILVVDDERDLRQFSAEVLSASGYQVDTAQDGVAGWQALHANHYDLLITDNNMPKVSGIELVKKLRSVHMVLPVVLASSVIPEEALGGELSLQLAATLLKPFTVEELLGTVGKVLQAVEGATGGAPPLPGREPAPAEARKLKTRAKTT